MAPGFQLPTRLALAPMAESYAFHPSIPAACERLTTQPTPRYRSYGALIPSTLCLVHARVLTAAANHDYRAVFWLSPAVLLGAMRGKQAARGLSSALSSGKKP